MQWSILWCTSIVKYPRGTANLCSTRTLTREEDLLARVWPLVAFCDTFLLVCWPVNCVTSCVSVSCPPLDHVIILVHHNMFAMVSMKVNQFGLTNRQIAWWWFSGVSSIRIMVDSGVLGGGSVEVTMRAIRYPRSDLAWTRVPCIRAQKSSFAIPLVLNWTGKHVDVFLIKRCVR